MKNVIRSARGELVNFDLISIKEQISSATPTITIRARENFIDQRSRRRANKITNEVIDAAIAAAAGKVNTEVNVDVSVASVDQPGELIEEEGTSFEPSIKQKAKKSEG